MSEKYKNPKFVKLAAELRATHYEGIMQLLFDIAHQLQDGKMDLSKSLINRLETDVQPEYLSPEHLQRTAAIAQNTQDRMIIGANLQIEGGKFREIANTYRRMQDTGVFSDEEVYGHKIDLNPEYTALELAASNQPK